MSTLNPFTATTTGTVLITPTASSVATLLPKGSIGQQVMVQSLAASAICYIEFGASTATAVIPVAAGAFGGIPILPNQIYTFTVGPNVTHVAVIGTAGSLFLTCGQGSVPT